MSVVAFDGRTIAADRQATAGDMSITACKLFRLADGRILATTGTLEYGIVLREWFESGMDREKWPAFQRTDNFARCILASPEGVFEFEKEPVAQPVVDAFLAWGSGAQLAIGAMAAGADARTAVKIASEYNVYCGRGVDVIDLDWGDAK